MSDLVGQCRRPAGVALQEIFHRAQGHSFAQRGYSWNGSPWSGSLSSNWAWKSTRSCSLTRKSWWIWSRETYNVFYIPEALGSPYVTVQEEFVIPFNVLFGTSGLVAFYLRATSLPLSFFLKSIYPGRSPTCSETAALSVKMAVLPFDGKVIFDEAGRGGEIGPEAWEPRRPTMKLFF